MKLLKNLGLCLSILFANTIHAQLEKGTKSFFGEGKIGVSNTKFEQYPDYQVNTTYLKLLPGFGSFVSNKVFVFARAGISSEMISEKYVSNNDRTENITTFSAQLGIRYYESNSKKFKLFGEISTQVKNYSTYRDGINFRNESSLMPSVGIGGDFLLNSSNALDFKLSYSKIMDFGSSNRGFGLLAFNVGLINFISKESKDEDMSDLTKEGRNFIDGTISVNHATSNGLSGSFISLTPEYAHFVLKDLMIGLKFSVNWEETDEALISIKPYFRYYIPITKKLFAYPNFSLNVKNYDKLNQSRSSLYKLNTDFGVGVSYFLRKNLAIEADVLKYELNTETNVLFAGLNVGLKYFIH
jgi:hypothetical protein